MTLGEMLKRAVHSDRLIIREADGREIYRGYVACMQYHGEIDPAREVKQFGLETDIFRRENRGSTWEARRNRKRQWRRKVSVISSSVIWKC